MRANRLSIPPAIAALTLFVSACNGGSLPGSPGVPPFAPDAGQRTALRDAASGKIKHVVILVQENRSFNDLFYGFKGATTVKFGYDSSGKKIQLKPVPLETSWDLEHDSYGFLEACNGVGSIPGTNCQMNGFNEEWGTCGSNCPPDPAYGYVPHAETKPYFDIGEQYVLADQMYASNFDASSFVSHQYIIAGQAESAINYPLGDWGCPGGSGDVIGETNGGRVPDGNYEVVCWDPTTLGDELDAAHLTWAFYTSTALSPSGIWSAYQAIKHIYYGPDWKNDVFTPERKFFSDVSRGKLRAVSWITPTWKNSDHAESGSKTGPSWVASVVNAIGTSKYWDSTALFIFWDDYGGWYDPEPPAYADYDGLGMRIPMLIVSAYAKQGHVSHVPYEHGSILKFIEDIWGLPRLGASDTRAKSPEKDAFDFNKPPRAFKTIPAEHGIDYFLHQPIDRHPPDDN
jgi:phospholipase C